MTKVLLESLNTEERVDILKESNGDFAKLDTRTQRILSRMIAENESWLVNNQKVDMDNLPETPLLNETAGQTTADINVIAKLMMPIITRGFGQTSAIEICGTWPLKQDQGRIPYMRHYYTNDQANPLTTPEDGTSGQNVGIGLVVGNGALFAVGNPIINGAGATGVVRYIEGNSLFVELTAGAFAVGDNVSVAGGADTPVFESWSSEVAHNVFAQYPRFATIYQGEIAVTDIKEAQIGLDLMNVQADSHKLRIRYTFEFVHRMRDYYNADGEALLENTASLVFSQGLNKDVFNRAFTAGTVGGTSGWDYVADSDGRFEEEKIKGMMTMLNFRSADLLNSNFMLDGSFLIVDPIILAFFNSYGYVDTSMLPGGMAQPMKNAFCGILNGKFRLYCNPWLRSRTIIVGCKDFSGDSDAETRAGIFFHPYRALDSIQTIQDQTGQPVKYYTSFYGFTNHPFSATVSGNDFFRRVNITSLPNV